MADDGGVQLLWPTPIGLHRYADAATLNPLLWAATLSLTFATS